MISPTCYRRLLVSLLLTLASSATIMAQGTVHFANLVISGGMRVVDAPIFCQDGRRAFGDSVLAMLYARPEGSSGPLTPVGTAVTFLSGTGAGYWRPEVRVIDGIAPGERAVLDVRIWNIFSGATWEEASQRGLSSSIVITLGPQDSPAPMIGLQSVQALGVPCIPEPSPFAIISGGPFGRDPSSVGIPDESSMMQPSLSALPTN